MKKFLFSSFFVLTLMLITTGTAFAADGLVQLIAVRSDEGVPTFVFRVSEQFSQPELKGYVHVEGGNDYDLHCAQQDETTVVCHTSKAASGKNVVVGFAGATFWNFVPEYNPRPAAGSSSSQYCHTVYDYNSNFNGWAVWTEHCQTTEPNISDTFVQSGAPSGGGMIFTFVAGGTNWPIGGVTPETAWYQ